jgi:hypothetical protein
MNELSDLATADSQIAPQVHRFYLLLLYHIYSCRCGDLFVTRVAIGLRLERNT